MNTRAAVSDAPHPRGEGHAMTRSPGSLPERQLLQELRWCNVAEPTREYRFAPPRRWRFDFAWPLLNVAVEVEGGGFVNGAHTRGEGFRRNCEKYNEAALMGWVVIRVTPAQITSGEALAWIERALHEEPINAYLYQEARDRALAEPLNLGQQVAAHGGLPRDLEAKVAALMLPSQPESFTEKHRGWAFAAVTEWLRSPEAVEALAAAIVRATPVRQHGQLCPVSRGMQGPGGPCDCFIADGATAQATALRDALLAGREKQK